MPFDIAKAKVGYKLHCYGAIDSQVTITEASIAAQKNNPDPNTYIVDHDGELKKVLFKSLYPALHPMSQAELDADMNDEITQELKQEDLL